MPSLSLRVKLSLVLLAFLSVPIAGYRFITEMEAFLRHGQEQALLGSARLLAATLQTQPGLLPPPGDTPLLRADALDLPMETDGYEEDWLAQPRPPAHRRGQNGLGLRLGHRADDLYLLLIVPDTSQRYRDGSGKLGNRVTLELLSADGERRNYRIAPYAPGPLILSSEASGGAIVRGTWTERSRGFQLELRIPRAGNLMELDVGVFDADRDRTDHVGGRLWLTPAGLQALVDTQTPARGQLWVVDPDGALLVRSTPREDELPLSDDTGPAGVLARFIALLRLARSFERPVPGQIPATELERALSGESSARWRSSGDGGTLTLSVGQPLSAAGGPAGAVLAQQTNAGILLLQNEALARLLNLSMLAFAVAALALLWLGSRLVRRITRLGRQADAAVAADGRIDLDVPLPTGDDELGQLGQRFHQLLNRLAGNHRYLETLAAKLTHEIRTPLAVVRSSLENLEQADAEEGRRYLKRARDGLDRLAGLVNRMAEASRLEQTLERTEREAYDPAEVAEGCAAGYAAAFTPQRFETRLQRGLRIFGAPELLAQALDKMVDNARDFAAPGTAIRISLTHDGKQVRLSVFNQGSRLADGEIFQSMVSLRPKGGASHLGLGLYIVRLVARFHSGEVSAGNRDNGVEVVLNLPALEREGPDA